MMRRIGVVIVALLSSAACGGTTDGESPRSATYGGTTGNSIPAEDQAPTGRPADPPSGTDAGDPDRPVSNEPQAQEPDASPPGAAPTAGDQAADDDRFTQPKPGQAHVRARRWESASVHADDVTIDITYWSGVEPCSVLDRVEVREEATRVVITLYEGSQPGFDGACTEQAVERTTRVTLSRPLRSRALIDGSDAP